MYIPASYRETDRAVLLDFLAAHPLGVLVSTTSGGDRGLYATHLPLHVDRERGVLQGHLARANPHVGHLESLAAGERVLVVFNGVDAYITPSWYPAKQEHGKVVPTWNFSAVHVHGAVTLHHDPAFLAAHLRHLTDAHESAQPKPWAVDDAPAEFITQQMRAIVGLEIAIDVLEGKFKMSQNRSHADIDGVITGLGESGAAPGVVAEMIARKPAR
ncbi:MAG TPA: FMN-binding negative transcriptional regulator [Gemmatimonas sp.]|uniref:FMN-binding negative transcriptional regulator n=1 Tax=Gemmatimonas sp. TaxID=1962908 RepID=UPI002EDBA07F